MWPLYSSASIFALLAALCGLSIILALPGIWLMILLAVIHEIVCAMWLGSTGDWFAWTAIGIAILIAFGAEVVELFASAGGAMAGGASKWGMLGALIGGVVGALLGTVFIPIPLIGGIAGAAGGATSGAIVGEITGGRKSLRSSLAPAAGAAVGRLLGMLAKVPFAIAAWIVLVVGALWR